MIVDKIRARIIAIPGIADLLARENLEIVAAIAVPFNFDRSAEVWRYQLLRIKCCEWFGQQVRWRTDRRQENAVFGFTREQDAIEFVRKCDGACKAVPSPWRSQF